MRPSASATIDVDSARSPGCASSSATSGSTAPQPLGAEHVLVGGPPGPRVHLRDRGGVVRPRAPHLATRALLAGGGGDELRDGVDLRGGERALERRHDAAADLDLVLDDRARDGFSWSRFGPIVPVAPRRLQRVAARAVRLEDRLAVVAGCGGGWPRRSGTPATAAT